MDESHSGIEIKKKKKKKKSKNKKSLSEDPIAQLLISKQIAKITSVNLNARQDSEEMPEKKKKKKSKKEKKNLCSTILDPGNGNTWESFNESPISANNNSANASSCSSKRIELDTSIELPPPPETEKDSGGSHVVISPEDESMIEIVEFKLSPQSTPGEELPTMSPNKSPDQSLNKSSNESQSESPSKSPSKSSSESPIKSPKKSVNKSTKKSLNKSPSESPTNTPIGSLVKSPSKSPSESPIKSPKKSPNKLLNKSPKKSLNKSPSESPIKSPTNTPSGSPVKSPNKSPNKSPDKSPKKSPSKRTKLKSHHISDTSDSESADDDLQSTMPPPPPCPLSTQESVIPSSQASPSPRKKNKKEKKNKQEEPIIIPPRDEHLSQCTPTPDKDYRFDQQATVFKTPNSDNKKDPRNKNQSNQDSPIFEDSSSNSKKKKKRKRDDSTSSIGDKNPETSLNNKRRKLYNSVNSPLQCTPDKNFNNSDKEKENDETDTTIDLELPINDIGNSPIFTNKKQKSAKLKKQKKSENSEIQKTNNKKQKSTLEKSQLTNDNESSQLIDDNNIKQSTSLEQEYSEMDEIQNFIKSTESHNSEDTEDTDPLTTPKVEVIIHEGKRKFKTKRDFLPDPDVKKFKSQVYDKIIEDCYILNPTSVYHYNSEINSVQTLYIQPKMMTVFEPYKRVLKVLLWIFQQEDIKIPPLNLYWMKPTHTSPKSRHIIARRFPDLDIKYGRFSEWNQKEILENLQKIQRGCHLNHENTQKTLTEFLSLNAKITKLARVILGVFLGGTEMLETRLAITIFEKVISLHRQRYSSDSQDLINKTVDELASKKGRKKYRETSLSHNISLQISEANLSVRVRKKEETDGKSITKGKYNDGEIQDLIWEIMKQQRVADIADLNQKEINYREIGEILERPTQSVREFWQKIYTCLLNYEKNILVDNDWKPRVLDYLENFKDLSEVKWRKVRDAVCPAIDQIKVRKLLTNTDGSLPFSERIEEARRKIRKYQSGMKSENLTRSARDAMIIEQYEFVKSKLNKGN